MASVLPGYTEPVVMVRWASTSCTCTNCCVPATFIQRLNTWVSASKCCKPDTACDDKLATTASRSKGPLGLTSKTVLVLMRTLCLTAIHRKCHDGVNP